MSTQTFIILSGAPFGVTGGGQQPAQLARQLVLRGHKVGFYQDVPSRVQPPGIQIVGVPANCYAHFWFGSVEDSYSYWWGFIQPLWPLRKNGHVVVCCPIPWFVGAHQIFKSYGWRTSYFVLDDWSEITKQRCDWYNARNEEMLVRTADHVLVTAEALRKKVDSWGVKAHLVPNGYDASVFDQIKISQSETLLPDPCTKRLIYWGCLDGPWFDWTLVRGIAEARPDWEVHLIGGNPSVILDLPNVVYHGTVPTEELMKYRGDVGIIPFKINAVSEAVDPIKAYEYLACGMPVVASVMPQLNHWPGVTMANPNVRDWVAAVERTVLRPRVQQFLQGKSWRDRAHQFLEVVSA